MWNWVEKAYELNATASTFAMVTIVDSKGSTPRNPGAKIIVLEDGSFFGTIGGGKLEEEVIEQAMAALKKQKAMLQPWALCARTGQCCGGSVTTFTELVGFQPQLFVFGAGHVGQAISRTLQGTQFKVHLIDPREEWINHKDLPENIIRHQTDPLKFIDSKLFDAQRAFALVMTWDHDLDLKLIEKLATRPLQYLGLIGSETKWLRFESQLLKKGMDEDALGRIQCPIGLPIGGKTPQEIAISFAAEALKLINT